MERKKIMTWMLTWLNVSAAALNATLQLLVIYRYRSESKPKLRFYVWAKHEYFF